MPATTTEPDVSWVDNSHPIQDVTNVAQASSLSLDQLTCVTSRPSAGIRSSSATHASAVITTTAATETVAFVWVRFLGGPDGATLVDSDFLAIDVSATGPTPFAVAATEPGTERCTVEIYWSYLEQCGPEAWPDDATVRVEGREDEWGNHSGPIVPGPC